MMHRITRRVHTINLKQRRVKIMITVRKEREKDYAEIYTVVKEAFASAEHADGNEQELVDELRRSEAFIPELSLVAVEGDKIVGHIMFTKNRIGDTEQLTLAPLAILPEYQRMGIGKALINAGHEVARRLGYDYSVVIGSNVYYPKLGYRQAKDFGITFSGEIPDENFMAIHLQGQNDQCPGAVIYPKEFGL